MFHSNTPWESIYQSRGSWSSMPGSNNLTWTSCLYNWVQKQFIVQAAPFKPIYWRTANPSQPRPKVMGFTTVLQSAGNSTLHWIRHQLSLFSARWNSLFTFKLNSALPGAHHLSQRSPHRSLLLSVLPTERRSLTKPLHAAFTAVCKPAPRQRSRATN